MDYSSSDSLIVRDVKLLNAARGIQIIVSYPGKNGFAELTAYVANCSTKALFKACEKIAVEIFCNQRRYNPTVSLGFAFACRNKFVLWQTNSALFVKCPLIMSMCWRRTDLRKVFRTMSSLGIIEISSIGDDLDTAMKVRLLLDAMMDGLKFTETLLAMDFSQQHGFGTRGSRPLMQ